MTSRSSEDWDIGAMPLVAPETLDGIVTALADMALVVTADGHVRSVLAEPRDGTEVEPARWRDEDLRTFLTVESVPKFEAALDRAASATGDARPVELNHVDPVDKAELPIAYTFHPLGGEAGILMLGRDLRPVSAMQQQLVDAQIALEGDYERQREYDTRFRVLLAASRDAVLIVSVADGRIVEANGVAAGLLGRSVEELTGQEIVTVFDDRGRGEFMADMAASALAEGASPIGVTARDTRRALKATPSFFRAAGNRMMLCRLEAQDHAEAPTDDLARGLSDLYDFAPEAIVFVDRDGTIVSANEAFLNMTETGHDVAIRNRSIADYLGRGIVDMKVLLENATRQGRMRLYSTKLNGQYRAQRAVEISATALVDARNPGFVLVMRDATVGDTARALQGGDGAQDASRSVVDLVGSASLKEIVADTTEVIEKVCIEAAVGLTSNNRVAAAEMLGLSRQSLYVKLRKYGMVSRGEED
ncbi:transcriptional regulator PpsR [Jannaschia sp. S6380]|uniref:transcriptional regulator PpsR n=1 Tax=Jannaschia sp. S6380 TaxID=2926408 RepID=UPI001FF424DA|nr:transcriptional regulator PpsR [Jannaschia sp. S6380]MCK0167665.1 transcriptional regulator PpsR [Jannaschia sp. S6380]